jgi:hypothetical protein
MTTFSGTSAVSLVVPGWGLQPNASQARPKNLEGRENLEGLRSQEGPSV